MAQAEIGIRVLLQDAASRGLYSINTELGRMEGLTNRAGLGFGKLSVASAVGMGAIAGLALSVATFGILIVKSIQLATQFQTILIQMGRAGNLTQAQMDALGKSLMDIGGHSIFSIEELGQAFVVLLQRGVSAADIMKTVGQQAVYLAEATGMKAVPAAQLLASTLISFHIPASQAAQTVDLLQFAIEHGIGPSEEMAASLTKLGSIAYVLHLNLADIIPAFDVLSRATGSYSLAATNLYYFLNQVKFGTSTYRDEIQKLGISFYDARGNFIGLNAALELLYKTLQNKTPEEAAKILGSLFNIRSSQGIAILEQGLKGVYDLTNKLVTSSDNMGVAMKRAQQAEQSAAGLWQAFRTNLQDVLTLMGGPFLAGIQPVLSHLNDLAIQLRGFAASSPKVAAGFLAIGLAISAGGLIAALIIINPALAVLLGVMIGLYIAVPIAALALQNFAREMSGDMGKAAQAALIAAQNIKAANLIMEQGADVKAIHQEYLNQEQMAKAHADLEKKIASTHSADMKTIYRVMLQDLENQQVDSNLRANQKQADYDALQVQLEKTTAGRIVLARRAMYDDLRSAADLKKDLAVATKLRDQLWAQMKITNDGAVKLQQQHELKILNDRIASDNLQLLQIQKDVDKQKAVIKTNQDQQKTDLETSLQARNRLVSGFHNDNINNETSFWRSINGITSQQTAIQRQTVVQIWTAITSYLGQQWNLQLQSAQRTWNNITTYLQQQWNLQLQSIERTWNNIVSFIQSIPGRVQQALSSFASQMFNTGSNAMGTPGFLGGLVSKVGSVLGAVGALPGRIVGSLGNTWGMLYGAGQNIIQGLVNGIWSVFWRVQDAIWSITDWIASHLPFSPVRMGPLVGIDKSGLKLMQMIATGIDQGAPLVQGATDRALGGMVGISNIVQTHTPINISGSGGMAPTIIYLDGKVIYDNTMHRLRGDLQMNGLGRAFR